MARVVVESTPVVRRPHLFHSKGDTDPMSWAMKECWSAW